jgi:opacity protein-like surface antigen
MMTIGQSNFARAMRKRLITAGLVSAGIVAAVVASAADLPINAPVVGAHYNWSGCYVGGFFGWGVANDWHTTDLNGYNPGGQSPWVFSLNSSPTGGGYAGCNWQPWAGGLVLGIEGEGGYLGLSGPGIQPLAGSITDASKIGTGYGLVAGRIGWAFYEKILIYAKVGVAFFNDSSALTDGALPGGPVIAQGSRSQSPLAYGGGVEYPLSDHWIGRAEYLVFDKGNSYLATGVVGGATFSWKEDPSIVQTFKLGAAYKF